VIIRILGDGQFEVPDDAKAKLDALDAAVDHALTGHDEEAFQRALSELDAEIRAIGTPVAASTILPSDLILPHEGASLGEISELLGSEEI
jgi:hypothetical protein